MKPFDYNGMYYTISRYKQHEFKWGLYDCCMFVADCLHAATGEDYAGDLRGAYDSKKTATAALKPYGGIEGYLNETFNPVPVNFARRGDIVLFEGNGVFSVGLHDGRQLLFMDTKGIQCLPVNKVTKAWRVRGY